MLLSKPNNAKQQNQQQQSSLMRLTTQQHEILRQLLILSSASVIDDNQITELVQQFGNDGTSKKLLMDCLLDNLVGSTKFDPNTNYKFRSPSTITIIFTLLPYLSEEAQLEILDIFIVLLEECSIDNSLASSVGLVQTLNYLLMKHELFTLNVVQKLIYLIGIVGSFSLSARELKTLIKLMRKTEGEETSLDKDLSPLILEVIRKMSRYESPSSFFGFDGQDCGVVADNISFPYNGYTFSCWLRIERTTKSNLYRFFSFFDKKLNGLEFFFRGNHIVIQTVSGGKKIQNVQFDYFFHTNRWYYISFTQNKRFMLKSDICLYVDGECRQTADLKYPSIGGQVTFGHFCTNIPCDHKQLKVEAFCGQAGPIAIFDKVFTLQEIQKLYWSGPDFQYTFKKGDSQPRYFDWPSAETYAQKLVFVYNPRSCTKDNRCIDNSPTKKGFSTDGRLLQGTSIFVAHPVKDTLICIGGIEVLFPLFGLLKKDWTVDYSMCARIVSLITEMLRHNKKVQEDMLQKNSLCTMGYILSQVPPEHINHDTLKALQGLVECASAPNDPILRDIFLDIFLNFELWINVDFDVHSNMLHFLHDEVSRNPEYFHEIVGVQYVLDCMRFFFWYKPDKEPERFYKGSNRPKEEEVYALRLQLSEIMKAIIRSGINKTEVEAITAYITDCNDEKQVIEMLKWILVLIDEEIPNLIDLLSDEKIMPPLLNLLTNSKKKIRIFSLKLIGRIMERGNSERRSKFRNLGYFLMVEQLLLNDNYDDEMYTVLLELILNKMSFNINTTISADLSKGGLKISFTDLLGPFFNLAANTGINVKERALKDINQLLKSNPKNRVTFAQQFGWQNWILQLAIPEMDVPKDRTNSLFELSIETISIVLSEYLLIKDGYELLKDTFYFIDVICDRKEIDRSSAYISLLKHFLPFIIARINNTELNKDLEFWRNLFHMSIAIEDFILSTDTKAEEQNEGKKSPAVNEDTNNAGESSSTTVPSSPSIAPVIKLEHVHEEKIGIVKYIMQGFDHIIKMSIKDSKAMDLLHYDGFKKSNSPFILQTILNIANDFTNAKSALPTPSYFYILFRLQLYLLSELDEKEINDGKHLIRMLALLSNDIQHTRVPKPSFKSDIQEDSVSQIRVLYTLAKLFVRYEEKQLNIIPIITALLRKNKQLLANSLTNPLAKDFLNSNINCIEQDSSPEEFIFSFNDSEEWQIVKDSPPFNAVYKEAKQEDGALKQTFAKKREEKVNEILKQIEKTASSDAPKLKKCTQDAQNLKTHICFTELQRLNNWRDGLRRKYKITFTEWKKQEAEYCTETGVWAKDYEEDQVMYLDPTENSKRMRMRIVKKAANKAERSVKQRTESEEHYDDWSSANDLMSSIVNIHPNEQSFHEAREDEEEKEPEVESEEEEEYSTEEDDIVVPGQNEESDWETVTKTPKEGLYLNREEEETVLIVPCELVVALDTIKGTFEITNEHIYFMVTGEEENKNEQNQLEDNNGDNTNNQKANIESLKALYDQKWSIEEIFEIYKRRYLLRYTAIEIFFLNRTAYFFNFDKTLIEGVIKALVNQRPPNLKFHAYSLTPDQLIKRSRLTQKWQRREISNFEYLMALNTFANRTYNDLTQYPVFPWVIKDYTSETIDINDTNIYRDLSKPVGALNEKRLKNILERYDAFQDSTIPKFHYGSHYSSVGVVLFYLLRLEPFTAYNIKLQGGAFDLPDRLFHSLPVTWENCMTSNSDVKELIPEFFYQPEFIRNNNELNLGVKQNKEIVSDVVLPPWAKTPEDFIRLNREALESEYVSEHLHEWIDLIFGYKQTGDEAEKAYNLFYYLTYEGAVDLDSIEDPLQRKAIETQISNFGQTPSQLFKKPHPTRHGKKVFRKPSLWKPNSFIPTFTSSISSVSGCSLNDVVFVQHIKSEDKIYAIDISRQLYYLSKVRPKPTLLSNIGCPMAKDVYTSHACFVCSKDGKWLFSCGHFDKSIKCSALFDRCQVKQSVFHHTDVVTCLCLSPDGRYLISGSADATVNVYTLNYLTVKARPSVIKNQVKEIISSSGIANAAAGVIDDLQLMRSSTMVMSSKEPLSNQPNTILYGHEAAILCVDVSSDLDIVVSGDSDGCVLVHTLNEGRYIRTIEHPMRNQVNLVKISSDGHIVMHSEKDCTLHLFSINGRHICSVDTNDRLKDILITPESKYVICGGMKKQVTIRRLYDLVELHTFETCSAEIRSITISHPIKEKYQVYREFIVSLADGSIHGYPVDPDILDAPRVEYESDNEALEESYQLV
ncbi:hypothetical protein ABK040_006908 [Willaertia magna]